MSSRDDSFSLSFGGPSPARGPVWKRGMPWPLARTVVDREELESTNDMARSLLQSGLSQLPLLVRARRQTHGRGRGENAWWSDAGSLTFTLGLDPTAHGLVLAHEPRLALAAAVAVVDAVAPFVPQGKSLGIRWPNDVEVGGRKLGGVLPERVDAPNGPRILIGIGLNVMTRIDDAPAEIRRMAASLADDASPIDLDPNVDGVLAAVLAGLESVLPRLANDDPMLAQHWASLDLLLGRPIRIDLGPRVVEGVGAGIDEAGALLVDVGSETLRLFGGRVLRDL
jgi:BirA family transcriptional regulator, biotin operon repressor / biotin---[acetyl-CoA-carboxylase] ligase